MAAHHHHGIISLSLSLSLSLSSPPLPKSCPNHAHRYHNTILNLAQSIPPHSSQLLDLRRRGKRRRKWALLPYCSANDDHPSFGTHNEPFSVEGEYGLGNANGSAATRTLLGDNRGTDNFSDGNNNSFSDRNGEERSSDEISTSSDRSNHSTSTSTSKSKIGGSPSSLSSSSSFEAITLSVKEPLYEVLQVNPVGFAVIKTISRRQLLKSSGLKLRDIRSVDPSLRITNSMPALLIRDQAILLNLGSLRAITTPHNVLVFDHNSIGGQAFLELLFQRLNIETNGGIPSMPFELEVVESALLSWTQRLERRLMEIEPRVQALLEILPNSLTANVLEELRVSKQALVELGSEANAFRQVLLELLEHPHEIRRMTAMGRQSTLRKDDRSLERSTTITTHKQSADDEEEEIEMLLENYLQRCESCHGQAERLLDSAKEMEDSIAVNLSSRRLEVSRLELLLQVGTFCTALGALIAGIFGMNLKSYLEERMIAFWLMSFGIILGGIVLFFIMYNHLKRRKIL